jgi:hypothetical protein
MVGVMTLPRLQFTYSAVVAALTVFVFALVMASPAGAAAISVVEPAEGASVLAGDVRFAVRMPAEWQPGCWAVTEGAPSVSGWVSTKEAYGDTVELALNADPTDPRLLTSDPVPLQPHPGGWTWGVESSCYTACHVQGTCAPGEPTTARFEHSGAFIVMPHPPSITVKFPRGPFMAYGGLTFELRAGGRDFITEPVASQTAIVRWYRGTRKIDDYTTSLDEGEREKVAFGERAGRYRINVVVGGRVILNRWIKLDPVIAAPKLKSIKLSNVGRYPRLKQVVAASICAPRGRLRIVVNGSYNAGGDTPLTESWTFFRSHPGGCRTHQLSWIVEDAWFGAGRRVFSTRVFDRYGQASVARRASFVVVD